MNKFYLLVALTLFTSACVSSFRSNERTQSLPRSPSSENPSLDGATVNVSEECGELAELPEMKFCITKSQRSSRADVLYFMHLGNGNEHQWKENFSAIHAELEKRTEAPPVVITISFGPFWLLVEKNRIARSGLLEVFRDQIIPKIENVAIGRRAARRYLMGGSMGGFNAAELLLKLPKGTFDKAVVACPSLLDLSPWASADETESFLRRTKANPQTIKNTAIIAKKYVPDDQTWKHNVNPLDLIQLVKMGKEELPPILIAGNIEDRTFFEGAEIFSARAKSIGVPVLWQRWPGGHCQIDAAAVGEFFKSE